MFFLFGWSLPGGAAARTNHMKYFQNERMANYFRYLIRNWSQQPFAEYPLTPSQLRDFAVPEIVQVLDRIAQHDPHPRAITRFLRAHTGCIAHGWQLIARPVANQAQRWYLYPCNHPPTQVYIPPSRMRYEALAVAMAKLPGAASGITPERALWLSRGTSAESRAHRDKCLPLREWLDQYAGKLDKIRKLRSSLAALPDELAGYRIERTERPEPINAVRAPVESARKRQYPRGPVNEPIQKVRTVYRFTQAP